MNCFLRIDTFRTRDEVRVKKLIMAVLQTNQHIAAHAKDTTQVWRDCAGLRISLQGEMQFVHAQGFEPEAEKATLDVLEDSIFRLLAASASRVSKVQRGNGASWESLNALNDTMMKYCLGEADLWHEKTKAPNRKNLKALDQCISAQMNYVMTDPDQRAVKRCKGLNEDEYDDAPLYAALLKESVQKGASGDAYAAMKMASKFGKKASVKEVDRRASKGRKIRYSKIEKLVNFTSARPVPLSEGIPITDELLISAFVNSVFQKH